MTKKYYKEIDILKGIAIILVVLGHSISYLGESSKSWSLVNEVIYNFHMPIFFFASGFLSNKILEFKKIELGYMKNKAIRMLLPYCSCGLLYLVFRKVLSMALGIKYDSAPLWKMLIGVNPSYSLWFLYVLFICLALSILFVRKNNIVPIMIAALLLSVFLGFITPDGYSPLNILSKIFKNYIYVLLGIYCGANYDKLVKYFNIVCTLVSLAVFVASNVALHYVTEGIGNNALKIPAALSAIVIIISIARKVQNLKVSNILKILGISSMGIFVISGFIQPLMKSVLTNKVHLNVTCSILICFFGSLLISLLATYLIKKIKIVRLIILGEQS